MARVTVVIDFEQSREELTLQPLTDALRDIRDEILVSGTLSPVITEQATTKQGAGWTLKIEEES